MAIAGLGKIDIAGLRRTVGDKTFQRGLAYALDQRVLSWQWHPDTTTLTGRVEGSGNVYQTTVRLGAVGTSAHEYVDGACSCPVAVDCKHVVALVAAAEVNATTRRSPGPRRPAVPDWERSLAALLDGAAVPGETAGIPLAVELTLDLGRAKAYSPTTRLLARMMRPGRNGWVNGSLAWSAIEWQLRYDGYVPAQLEVLRRIYAAYRTRPGTPYAYNAKADKSIDLAALDDSLWPLLDQATEAGVRLVHNVAALGDVDHRGHAEVCLDVTSPGGAGLLVTPGLVVDGRHADGGGDGDKGGRDDAPVPVTFLGPTGHGVVYVDGEAGRSGTTRQWRLRLARLARPVSPELRRLLLDDRRVEIPAGSESRFADELWPHLRHVATTLSSDGSFTPPAITGPTLVLKASYRTDHLLELGWEWAYEVSGVGRRAPMIGDTKTDGFRDIDAEQKLLVDVESHLVRLRLWTLEGLPAPVRLRGLETMRFTTEALPLLRDTPGVEVEIEGEPADFREVSDSVVVGLSTEVVPGQTDWYDLGVRLTVEGRELPFTQVFAALAAGESDLLLPDGAYLSLQKPELQALRALIEEARALQDGPPGELRISRYQVGLWDELAALGVVQQQADTWQRQIDALRAVDTPGGNVDLPTGLEAELRPYQREGYAWLRFLWEHKLGGILADDMGLGKTLQALGLMVHARDADPALAPFLVVAPTSVVPNWATEARRFAPDLKVVAVADTMRKAGRTIDEVVDGAHVVVTSYTLFRLDADAYNHVEWAGLVLDEAQATKNHRSKVYGCIRQLPTPFKLAITGTPMENNLMELWSLLSITAPGLFPNPTRFTEMYTRPIERQGDVELLAQLRRRIKPLMRRRTKEQVATDLPAKQEQVLEVDLHPKHRKAYDTLLARERQRVMGLVDDLDRNRFMILKSLTQLRQLSLHPGLVDPDDAAVPSVKLDTLVDQLREVVDGGHRALVFSQFTRFLSLARARLEDEGIDFSYLDGRTRKRAEVIDRFKDGAAPVFLISLKAGGFGLNLTEADYCFLLDPWWNPATEAQAVDRVHRIGQTRNVMVYRLIARNTIEEKVVALKQRKAELFSGVMDEGQMFSTALDADDIRELLS